jgi:excisionase family DNA binding protein
MSEANVYRMVRKRAIPGFRLGARWRFRIADLEQFATDMVASRPISTNEVGYEQRGAV